MKKLASLLFTITVLSIAISAQKPPRGDTDVPATSIIDNSVGSPNLADDGLGAYINGVNSVESIVQGIGDWVLNTRNSTVRKVYIDLSDPANAGDPPPPFVSALRPARLISKCAQLGFKIRDMQSGQSRDCPLAVAFDYNGINYRLAFNDSNFAVTDYVKWTCLNVANGRCVSWAMEPSTVYDLETKAKGQLIKVGTSRKNPDQPLGVFYFSFRLYVTTP